MLTVLSLCLCGPLIVWFFNAAVSYRMKVGDQFFPKLLVLFLDICLVVETCYLENIRKRDRRDVQHSAVAT